ncbi:MAG TPA: hypothetical protein VEW03_08485 [Longimicrobiaceae bacterium]|nr:hypothetical protein [Longimicrobiaceae bacterium]
MRNAVLAAALVLASTLPIAAQSTGAGSTLSGRMRGFLGALGRGTAGDSAAAFFPRHGDWTWMQTLVDPPAVRGVGSWRFPGTETRKAMQPGGPLCNSLAWSGGDFGPWEGALVMQVMVHPGGWRRVTPTRFVPPGASSRSPTFVEWRREDDRWVVSALGDEGFHWTPPPAETIRNLVTRDTMPTGNTALAAGQPWYIGNEMLAFGGRWYLKYGLPRRIAPDQLRRVGSLGTVPVYVEGGAGRHDHSVLYVPVRPGELHPYQVSGGSSCDAY